MWSRLRFHRASGQRTGPLPDQKEKRAVMHPEQRRRVTIACLLGATLLAVVLYLSGIAATLPLGDAGVRGVLLIPALPTPMYVVMALVVLAGVGLTLLASTLQRRRRRPPDEPRASDAPVPFWQSLLTMLITLALLCLALVWLIRHAPRMQAFLDRIRGEIGAIQEALASGTGPLVDQISSPGAGYALFVVVIVIYGGMALLALWVLCEDRGSAESGSALEDPQTRRVHRAMTAGLRELREHADPRHAIIACYARLEHLLEDHGVPASRHLTPQEYMGTALRGLNLPADAMAGLIQLFELARYSLHPLDDMARTTAIAHLERLKTSLEGGEVDAGHA